VVEDDSSGMVVDQVFRCLAGDMLTEQLAVGVDDLCAVLVGGGRQ